MKKEPIKYGDHCIHGTNNIMTSIIGGYKKANS